MAERVRLTAALNRILWPRLVEMGFRLQVADEGDSWKEGSSIVRTGPNGREQALLIGRDKFGHRVGLNAARQLPDGSWEHLDTTRVGLSPGAVSYQSQAEAEAVLALLADAIELQVVPWLDQDPPTRELSAGIARGSAGE